MLGNAITIPAIARFALFRYLRHN